MSECSLFTTHRVRRVRTPCKGDLHIPWGDPVCERRVANLVSESDHAGDGLPTVLAKPEKVKYHPAQKKRDCDDKFVYVPAVRSDVASAGSRT